LPPYLTKIPSDTAVLFSIFFGASSVAFDTQAMSRGLEKTMKMYSVSGTIKAIAPENLDAPWLVYDGSHSTEDQSARATHQFLGLIADRLLGRTGELYPAADETCHSDNGLSREQMTSVY
jgi:hypothetical protein